MSYSNGSYGYDDRYNYGYDQNYQYNAGYGYNQAQPAPQPPPLPPRRFDAPPLPPKPPAEYIRGSSQQRTSGSFDMTDIDDILENYEFNDYNYPTMAHSIRPEPEPLQQQQRRPSQLRGPRQPSTNSGFGYQAAYQQRTHSAVPAPPPPPPPPPPQQPPRQVPVMHEYQNQPPPHPHQQPPAPYEFQPQYTKQPRYRNQSTMPSMIDTSYPVDTSYVHQVVEPEHESSSVSSSIPSSVQRTTSTNTADSHISIPEEKDVVPDRYQEHYVEQPAEIPQMSPHVGRYSNGDPYAYVDDSISDEEPEHPSFINDLRNELNQPKASPPLPQKSTFRQPAKPSTSLRSPAKSTLPSPIPQSPSTRRGTAAASPHTPSRTQELDQSESAGSIGKEDFHIARRHETPTKSHPHRMKTIGSNGPHVGPMELSLPRSTSAKESVSGYGETLNSSMRSSSRSTADDTLMKALDLPSIPASRKSFDAAKLSSRDFDRCFEIWSLSSVSKWLAGFHNDEGDMQFEQVSKALVGLFTHHIPTLNWLRAERIAEHAVDSIAKAEFITIDDSNVKVDNRVEVTGVLPLLTQGGCYTSHVHDDDLAYRCYSPRCSRTLAMRADTKVDLGSASSSTDWAQFWKLDQEEVASLDKKETKRQYAIHELIVGEEGYIRDLNTLVDVYGGSLEQCQPPIMKDQDTFYENAFACVKELIDCNTKHLLSCFKERQEMQGPYIEGIADIVLNWCKEARGPYVNYADSYLLADRRLRQERESNPAFASWFERVSKDPRTKGVPHSFYFHRAIPRLARYGLLLKTIQKATPESNPEWELLDRAITECDSVTGECNKRLATMEKQVEIMDLHKQIRFKSQEETADLRLRDGKRKIIRRGDVLRRGDYRMDWVTTHMMLFDNFLVLSKVRKTQSGTNYYVTKRPIPMDLLVLESANDEGVTKSSSSKLGVGTFTYHASDNKRLSVLAPPSPTKSAEGAVTTIPEADKEVMYPFKISHLGRNGHSYTLYAPSKVDRQRWKDAIITAKREYSSAVYALNAEPFRMKVVSELAFAYDTGSVPRIPVFSPATVLDRALNEYRAANNTPKQVPRPLARSRINCGVSFLFADGLEYTFLGLEYGVFVCSNAPNAMWRKCIEIARVVQINVIEELNVLVMLADKALVYYDLDAVLTSKPSTKAATGATHAQLQSFPGYRLSKHREVGFFQVGYMKDRSLLFYKRREGMSSVFKVLEPVKEKGSQRKRSKMVFTRAANLGSTEYFREVEKFYVPTDAYGISLFKSSFAVQTTRGFEVMSLDVKLPQTVPTAASLNASSLTPIFRASNFAKPPTVESFKKRLESTRPVGMFRISETSLILCYEDFAVFCDNHGNIVGPSVFEFVGRARDVALQLPYLLVFDDEMVEVRRIDRGGQLKQVISGKDIRAVDTHEGQIKISLAHPELSGRQVVVELIGNEFVVEDDNSSLAGL